VQDAPVATIDQFRSATTDAWSEVPSGEMVQLVFDHDGTEVVTTVLKPKATTAPRPDLATRPKLFETPK
jgi:hypothetical protein